MKRSLGLWSVVCGLLSVVGSIPVPAADAVQPASCAITNFRGEAISSIPGTFYRGTSLLFTNCVLYSGAGTNSAKQGLSGVAVEVRVGTTESNVAYTATVTDTQGVWSCTATIPALSMSEVQVKLTDVNTNIYIYPWKHLLADTPLE